jgi:hypothetical protein
VCTPGKKLEQRITPFDRTAIGAIAAVAVLVGLLMASVTDLMPSLGLYVMFPGLVVAPFMYKGFGLIATIVGCGVVNGVYTV